MGLFNTNVDTNVLTPEFNSDTAGQSTQNTEPPAQAGHGEGDQSPQSNVEPPQNEPQQPDTQTAQGKGTEQPSDGGEQQEQLLAGKYKSPQELEKAYQQLQRKYTQTAQNIAQLRKTTTPDSQTPQQMGVKLTNNPAEDFPNLTKAISEQLQNNMYEAIAPMNEKVEDLLVQNEIMRLANNDVENFEAVAPKFNQVLQENPMYFDMPNGLENAYKLAKADYIMETADNKVNQAREEAYDRQGDKLKHSEGASRPKQPQAEKTPEQEIAEGIALNKPHRLFGK